MIDKFEKAIIKTILGKAQNFEQAAIACNTIHQQAMGKEKEKNDILKQGLKTIQSLGAGNCTQSVNYLCAIAKATIKKAEQNIKI